MFIFFRAAEGSQPEDHKPKPRDNRSHNAPNRNQFQQFRDNNPNSRFPPPGFGGPPDFNNFGGPRPPMRGFPDRGRGGFPPRFRPPVGRNFPNNNEDFPPFDQGERGGQDNFEERREGWRGRGRRFGQEDRHDRSERQQEWNEGFRNRERGNFDGPDRGNRFGSKRGRGRFDNQDRFDNNRRKRHDDEGEDFNDRDERRGRNNWNGDDNFSEDNSRRERGRGGRPFKRGGRRGFYEVGGKQLREFLERYKDVI